MLTFKENLAAAWGHISTWVIFAYSATAAYWLQMDPLEQQAVFDAVPAMRFATPIIGFIAFLIAKGIPQSGPPPPTPPWRRD